MFNIFQIHRVFRKGVIELTLFFLVGIVFPNQLFSQWTSNTLLNTPVCTEVNNQKDFSIASDTKGGAYIVWSDKRNNILRADIYIQRLNEFGYPMWNSQGIGVCVTNADKANPSTTEDGNGGIIVAWDDSLNNDRDIYAQRFDSVGNPLWTLNGVPVVVKPNKQKDVKIISDGAGGAIVVWEDSSFGFWDIYAQRIHQNGNILWASQGVPVCTAVFNQKNPRLVEDGMGGAYIVWQDRRSNVDYDIYAQHINSSGTILWPANGIIVCNAVDKQTDPKIVSDGLGGAIVTWQDRRGGVDYDIYAQRLKSSDTLSWTTNGVAVCIADSAQTSIDVTSENVMGAIITWRDKRNSSYHDIYAQKINLNGTTAWQTNGVPVTTEALTQTDPNICGDGNGGAIIVWKDSVVGDWDIKSQRLNSSGVPQWNWNGNTVSGANNTQSSPKNISDGKGGSIYVWNDNRNGVDDDIYAQHFSQLGMESVSSVGHPRGPVFVSPNPVKDFATIYGYKIKNGNLTGIIYDTYGREIQKQRISNPEFILDVTDLVSGVYFLKLFDSYNSVYVVKVIVKN